MREHLYRVEAIVLKRTDIGEADRLLTIYTPDRGKLRAVAKGARKPTSRKAGHVELFNHVSLLVAVGRDLDVITQADTVEPFITLRGNLDLLSYAYYFAELVDRFCDTGEENRSIFDLILQTIHRLEEIEKLPRLARYFELRLLEALGYRPQLFHCVNCNEELLPEENFFTAEGGGMLNAKCRDSHRDSHAISVNALKLLRYLQNREFVEIDALRLTPQIEEQVEQVLHFYLTHLLERNLKSLEFLYTLRQQLALSVAKEPR